MSLNGNFALSVGTRSFCYRRSVPSKKGCKDRIMGYNIVPLKEWIGFVEFLELYEGSHLNEKTKSILTSRGSLTRLLEDLYKTPVVLELKGQDLRSLEDDRAELLRIGKSAKVLERNAWLKSGGERLVFAHSVIPVNNLGRDIVNSLEAGDRPLGYLLERAGISIQRDDQGIGMINCEKIAEDLNLPMNNSFWARRYCLKSDEKALAFITEVFSPNLFES